MDTRVLKEPRGFMRCLEWFFAIIAFATCVHFSTEVKTTIECTNDSPYPGAVTSTAWAISYPFKLDHIEEINPKCSSSADKSIQLGGDISSDAQFFVFTGVISFLAAMASLVVYVFFSDLYF